jgi:hypothetical protein
MRPRLGGGTEKLLQPLLDARPDRSRGVVLPSQRPGWDDHVGIDGPERGVSPPPATAPAPATGSRLRPGAPGGFPRERPRANDPGTGDTRGQRHGARARPTSPGSRRTGMRGAGDWPRGKTAPVRRRPPLVCEACCRSGRPRPGPGCPWHAVLAASNRRRSDRQDPAHLAVVRRCARRPAAARLSRRGFPGAGRPRPRARGLLRHRRCRST